MYFPYYNLSCITEIDNTKCFELRIRGFSEVLSLLSLIKDNKDEIPGFVKIKVPGLFALYEEAI